MARHFGFSDLHSFKDYVVFVQTYLPDRFPLEDWASPADQLTLDRAFEGLRLGLRMAVEEKGEREEFTQGESLVDDAYAAYCDGRVRDGFFKLQELEELLMKVPSQ